MLCEKYGIYEFVVIDRHFNRIISWRYGGDEDDELVPLNIMKQMKSKHKELFAMYKYEIPDVRYYDGL